MRRTLKRVATWRRTQDSRSGSGSRADAAADAIGSLRAEGLEPGRAAPLLAAWQRGELSDEQLEQFSLRLLHDRDITADELLASARAA